MKNRLLTAACAAALCVTMLTGAASAQDLGLKQLQDSASSAMARLNIDTSMVDMLTLEELAEVQAVASTSDTDQFKTGRIETILDGAEERIAAGGVTTPTGPVGDVSPEQLGADVVVKANVGAFIAQIGLADEVDVDMLTTDELLQVQLVQGDNSLDPAGQSMRIKELLDID